MPDLRVNMFGSYPAPDRMPGWVSYTKSASSAKLLEIYNGSALFVCASVKEGYGLTCVEAMACGCALATTDFAGLREYAIDGENALVSPAKSAASLALNIVRLLQDGGLRDRIGAAGVRTAQALRWDEAVADFENVLFDGGVCAR